MLPPSDLRRLRFANGWERIIELTLICEHEVNRSTWFLRASTYNDWLCRVDHTCVRHRLSIFRRDSRWPRSMPYLKPSLSQETELSKTKSNRGKNTFITDRVQQNKRTQTLKGFWMILLPSILRERSLTPTITNTRCRCLNRTILTIPAGTTS